MSTSFNLVPGRLNLNAVSGDDFAVLLQFKDEDGVAINLTSYTFQARILLDNAPSNRYQVITVTNTNLAEGRITLSLSDAQTQALGALSNRKWFITWSQGPETRTFLSGTFTLNQKWGVTDYSPTTENQTIIIETPTISIEVIGGVGGAVLWGDIQGDIEDQTDLIELLDSDYQPLSTFLTAISGLSSSNAGFVLRRNLANNGYEFSALYDIGSGNLLSVTPVTSVTNAGVRISPKGTGSFSVFSGINAEALRMNNTSRIIFDLSEDISVDAAGRDLRDGIGASTLNWNSRVLSGGSWTATGTFTSSNLSGTNTGDQYGSATASGANQYLRRNSSNSAYEFGPKTDILTISPGDGQSIAFDDNPTDQVLYINPSGDLTDIQLILPANANSIPAQKVVFCSSHNISVLTLTGATTIFNAPVSMNAGDCFQFYKMASNVWARVIT